jgi:hypothetical protein
MKIHRLLLGTLLAAVALAGCGASGPSGPQAEVEATIRRLTLSPDPANCTTLLTARLREQASGKTGAAALRVCERESKSKHRYNPTKSVAVSGVAVHGSTATAQAAYLGGAFDHQTARLSLVRKGRSWKIDRFDGLSVFHRAPLVAAFRVDLREGPEKHDPRQIECLAAAFTRAPRPEVEAWFLNTSDAAEIRLARRCPRTISAPTETARVKLTVGKLLTGENPTLCVELETRRFLERNGHGQIRAIEECVAGVRAHRGGIDAVRLSRPRVRGRRATVRAEYLTGELIGQEFVFELVERGGNWKADAILRMAKVDRLQLVKGILAGVSADGVEVTRPMTACLTGVLTRLGRSQVEDLFLRPSPDRALRLFGRCFGEAPAAVPSPV